MSEQKIITLQHKLDMVEEQLRKMAPDNCWCGAKRQGRASHEDFCEVLREYFKVNND